jgi:hypothetical protein
MRGKPTITFPSYNENGFVFGTRRINADPAGIALFPIDQFRNKFVVLTLISPLVHPATLGILLVVSPGRIDMTWRTLAEIKTSNGNILIKVPLFDDNIRKLVMSCS